MASLRNFWHRLLRAVRLGGHSGPHWVEPSNAVTRAIYEGDSFVTMATFEQPAPAFVPAAPAPVAAAIPAAEHAAEETAAPKRPEVAA
ncbi:MAG: hypothetical protein WD557_01600 [Dehalococcoidia bacterium]